MSRRPWTRALVTGASTGIGEALARRLASEGTDLVLVARNSEKLDLLAEELSVEHGVAVVSLAGDLTDPEALLRVESRVASTEDPIDLVINNAGLGVLGLFAERALADAERQWLLNVVALTRLTHAAVRRMMIEGQGTVLNVGSIAGYQPTRRFAVYNATKAYVHSFSQSVHSEVRAQGVTVTCVAPGMTRTEFQHRAGIGLSVLPGFVWQTADQVAVEALRAAEKGKALVTTGAFNKVVFGLASVTPRRLLRWAGSLAGARFR